MMNFEFNGTSFTEASGMGDQVAFVLGRSGFAVAERDYDSIPVPGRDGELTVDNNRWKNVPGTYKCFIQSGYDQARLQIQRWLSALGGGYGILRDTQEPGVFRMARFVPPVDEVKVLHDDIARIDISFDCMPQRFLDVGEDSVQVPSGAAGLTLINSTDRVALPLLEISGTGPGIVNVNGTEIEILDIGTDVTIDSAMQRAYRGTTPMDDKVSGCPVLVPGGNTIRFSGDITDVYITPRWWML